MTKLTSIPTLTQEDGELISQLKDYGYAVAGELEAAVAPRKMRAALLDTLGDHLSETHSSLPLEHRSWLLSIAVTEMGY